MRGGFFGLIGFKSDEQIADELRRERAEILGFEDVDLGEDWQEKVFASAKEQLSSNAFVEYDEIFGLVAHGEVKDSRCGTFMKRKTKALNGCLNVKAHKGVVDLNGVNYTNKVFVQRIFHSCGRPECPSCAISGYAVSEANRAERILIFASKEFSLDEVFHTIVSFPKDCGMSYEAMRKYLVSYLRSVGVVGGCYIYHHYRYHGRNETYEGEPARYLTDNPHFHCLVFIKGGYGCRACRCLREGTFDRCRSGCNGFEGVVRRVYDSAVAKGKVPLIVKVKARRKTIGGTLWYELSHASYRKDVKKQFIVNWFGCCARRKLKIPKGKLPQIEHLCPLCGSKLQRVKFLGDYKDLLAYMAVADERNKGLWLDAKDKDGNWLWRSEFADRYRTG